MLTTPAELRAMLFYLCEKTDILLVLPLSPDNSVVYQTFAIYFTVNLNTSIKSPTTKKVGRYTAFEEAYVSKARFIL